MIASLEGIVSQILDDSLVINVGGVGFRVFVPKNVCKEAELYKSRSFYTYLVVREDALTLFGFCFCWEPMVWGRVLRWPFYPPCRWGSSVRRF